MLIVALVLAVIGLAALVTAVVTSNELIAWVCIGASLIGVLLLIVDAVRERSAGRGGADTGRTEPEPEYYEDYPEDDATVAAESEDEAETSVVEQADGDVPGEDRTR
ncbi:DUF308 domain-containing protein [Mycobacterium sp. B14F4]|uniref:DUF308 domain-containing protein n=1 Tax=Mycobacterium sp. B14F4 TaxID=3153565 RepID=UPI00325E9986